MCTLLGVLTKTGLGSTYYGDLFTMCRSFMFAATERACNEEVMIMKKAWWFVALEDSKRLLSWEAVRRLVQET